MAARLSWLAARRSGGAPLHWTDLAAYAYLAVGVLLMFWNRVVGVFRRVLKFSSRK